MNNNHCLDNWLIKSYLTEFTCATGKSTDQEALCSATDQETLCRVVCVHVGYSGFITPCKRKTYKASSVNHIQRAGSIKCAILANVLGVPLIINFRQRFTVYALLHIARSNKTGVQEPTWCLIGKNNYFCTS